jgi:hypothetical protein
LLLVAQLAGEEGASTGEILSLDVATGQRTVLLNGLDKPTGVLWRAGELWVMERRALIRSAWRGRGGEVGPREVVLNELPFNGRSEGTLTPLPDGRFLYETSGTLDGDRAQEGSGTLWIFDPKTEESRVLATGAKNAYAHALLADGRIVTTEIGDNVTDPHWRSSTWWRSPVRRRTLDGRTAPATATVPASSARSRSFRSRRHRRASPSPATTSTCRCS